MRAFRFVKIIVPDIIAYISDSRYGTAMEPEYRCDCGMGLAREWECCPYCKAELDWDKVETPYRKFLKLFGSL